MKKPNPNLLIRRYIRILLESTDNPKTDNLKDLESQYHADIQTKNHEYQAQTGQGWNLLNTTIQKFKELDDPNLYKNQDEDYKYTLKTQLLQNTLSQDLGFKKLGEGYFRNVWGSPHSNFIVKIEKKVMNLRKKKAALEGTNEAEYMNYFHHGPDFQPRNDLFPKMYAYDTQDKAWIIFEKVNTFSTTNPTDLQKIFGPFSLLCQKILWVLMHDDTLTHDPIFTVNSYCYDLISNPNPNPEEFFNLIFKSALSKITKYFTQWGDLQIAFHHLLWDFIEHPLLEKGLELRANPKKYALLQQKLSHALGLKLFTPTPDARYICNFLKNSNLTDLHFGNLGYRDLKNHPQQPWKNLVILDFGDYGHWKG